MKVVLAIIGIPLSLGVAVNAFAAERPATLVLIHGRIHTQDAGRSIADAMALDGKTIVAVGKEQYVSRFVGSATRTIDLQGRVVIPGIIDAHIHPADGARDFDTCNLDDAPTSRDVLVVRLASCLNDNPGNSRSWFRVVGVHPVGLALTRSDLDAILPRRPMVVFASGGHTVWVNSAALTRAHVTAATKDPAGGHFERDAHGSPTGVLQDTAFDVIERAMPKPDIDMEATQLARAFAAMHARGITSVQDAAVDDHLIRMYKRLYDTHKLAMRVRASYKLANLRAPAKSLIRDAERFRTTWSVDPDYLRVDAVKIYADGVIEYPTQTAALLEPYLDSQGKPTDRRGPSYFTQNNLDQIVAAANAAGFTVHVHAIGDRAVRSALDAFGYARALIGPTDSRNQIAHLELVDPDDFPRFKALGVIANLQLDWAMRDEAVVKATLPYIGPERARHLYPARSLRDAGALIAGGSDWGYSFDAFESMEHAITRSEGRGHEPLLPEQSLGVQDIVDAYTINAAFALKQERTTGSLEPGKRGDFIVLDRDIFAIDPFEIHETKVLATYLDGREVYAAQTQ
jgi:predicted amidohydrolase YtcJ